MLIILLLLALSCFSCVQLEPLEFGVVADVQYADQPAAGKRHYRNSLEKLEECVSALNRFNLEFSIHLGDFIDKNFESFERPKAILSRLNSPVRHLLGKHDFSVQEDKRAMVPLALGLKKNYYSFKAKGWLFIVLNGNEISIHGNKAGSDNHLKAAAILKKNQNCNHVSWNGGLGIKQIQWVKENLISATEKKEKVIFFCHFPVYPANNVHNLWDSEEFISLIEPYRCVKAYINGHNHGGNYGIKQGIHYLTLEGVVDTEKTNAFARIKVENNALLITGFGRTKSRSLTLRD